VIRTSRAHPEPVRVRCWLALFGAGVFPVVGLGCHSRALGSRIHRVLAAFRSRTLGGGVRRVLPQSVFISAQCSGAEARRSRADRAGRYGRRTCGEHGGSPPGSPRNRTAPVRSRHHGSQVVSSLGCVRVDAEKVNGKVVRDMPRSQRFTVLGSRGDGDPATWNSSSGRRMDGHQSSELRGVCVCVRHLTRFFRFKMLEIHSARAGEYLVSP
jgi:hypothetical protein